MLTSGRFVGHLTRFTGGLLFTAIGLPCSSLSISRKLSCRSMRSVCLVMSLGVHDLRTASSGFIVIFVVIPWSVEGWEVSWLAAVILAWGRFRIWIFPQRIASSNAWSLRLASAWWIGFVTVR